MRRSKVVWMKIGLIAWVILVVFSFSPAAQVPVTSKLDPSVISPSSELVAISPAAAITVLAPNGGEVWPIGTVQTIQWTSSGVLGDVQIQLNRGSLTWETLFSRIPNAGSIQWSVTGPTTTAARIRIISLANTAVRDDSNATFSITNTPVPTLTVVAPNGREAWQVNITQTIQWSSTNLTSNVKIELTRDSGTTWATIITDTPNDGSEPWTVSGPDSAQCQVRISSVADSHVFDRSDDLFTISPADFITVTSPNGGEQWGIGSAHDITWSTNLRTGNAKIELSRNGGSTFETLLTVPVINARQSWTVTAPETIQAIIKLTSVDNPAVSDSSNATFTISQGGGITVLSPTIGSVWPIGTSQGIRWTSNTPTGTATIELSRDGGSSWETILASTANDGLESWTVTGPASTQCRLRITSTNGTFGFSDGLFTITPINLIAPDGGELWTIGTRQPIQWTSTPLTGNVKIELSRDGGQSFSETITASTPNDGVYEWLVTGPAAQQAKIRVSLVENPGFQDTSREPFTIVDPQQPVITSVEPGLEPVEPGQPWVGVINEGATTVLLLRGANLNSTSVRIPAEDQTHCFPTVMIIGGDAAGTWLEVQVQTPAGACVLPFYSLVVEKGALHTFLPLELKFASLRLNTFTPTQVQPGVVFVLEATGFNLDGAQLNPGPHLSLVSEVQVDSDSIAALIEVAADALPGQQTSLTVAGPRGSQTVPIQIVTSTASQAQTEETLRFQPSDFTPPILWRPWTWLFDVGLPPPTTVCQVGVRVFQRERFLTLIGCPQNNAQCLSTTSGLTSFRGVVLGLSFEVTVQVSFECLLGIPTGQVDFVCLQAQGAIGIVGGPGFQVVIDRCLGFFGTAPISSIFGDITWQVTSDNVCVRVTGQRPEPGGVLQGDVVVCCNGWVFIEASGTSDLGVFSNLRSFTRTVTLNGPPPPECTSPPPPTIAPQRLRIATGGTDPNRDDIMVSPDNAGIQETFRANFGGQGQMAILSYNPSTGSTRAVSAGPQDSSAIWLLQATSSGQVSSTGTEVIVPPQKLIQVLIGEDQTDLAQGNMLPPQAVGIVIQNRVNDSRWPNTYNEVITQLGQFASVGTDRYNNARTRSTAGNLTAYDNAVQVAADVYGLVPPLDSVTLGGAIAFGSPGAVGAQKDIDTLLMIANTTPCPDVYKVDAKTLGFDTRWFPRFETIDEQVILINEIPVETFAFIRDRPAGACAVIKAGFYNRF